MRTLHVPMLSLALLSPVCCGEGDRGKIVPGAADPRQAKAPVGDARPLVAPVPATVEEAARQFGDWLVDPVKAPVPALLTPTSKIEVRMHCGTCDVEPLVTTETVVGIDAMARLADRLRQNTHLGIWNVEPLTECKHGCCVYPPSPSGTHHVVDLVEVCVGMSADGRPTDYIRIGSDGA